MDEMFTKANERDQASQAAVEEHRRKRAELMAAMPAFSADLKQRLVDAVATYNEKSKAADPSAPTAEVQRRPGRSPSGRAPTEAREEGRQEAGG